MKNKIWLLIAVLSLGACADLSIMMPKPTEKAQLTPQGQLNACVLEEARTIGTIGNLNAAANKIANTCIRKLDMGDSGLYGQAVINAKSVLNSRPNN